MSISSISPYVILLSDIKSEFPDFCIVQKKDSNFMKTIDVLLKIITFGSMKQFMVGYITTIGHTVYVPENWINTRTNDMIVTLRHERVHMRQSKQYGNILFSYLYLFAWIPMFYAYWRTKFEKEAYTETLRTMYEQGIDIKQINCKQWIVKQFTSSAYGWMWLSQKDIEAWYDSVVSVITK